MNIQLNKQDYAKEASNEGPVINASLEAYSNHSSCTLFDSSKTNCIQKACLTTSSAICTDATVHNLVRVRQMLQTVLTVQVTFGFWSPSSIWTCFSM